MSHRVFIPAALPYSASPGHRKLRVRPSQRSSEVSPIFLGPLARLESRIDKDRLKT